MDFPSIRTFSERIDLLPILEDDNNREEAIKWAWINAFSLILCRQGISVTTPVFGCKRETEDGTMKIVLSPEACQQMHLTAKDPMIGATINLGIEAKRLATTYRHSLKEYRNAAFAQRVWYDANIYRQGSDTNIDVIVVCCEAYFAFAYKRKNLKVYNQLIDYYDQHPEIRKPCEVYDRSDEIQKIVKNVVWEPIYYVDDNLCAEDIISKILMDTINGGNA